MKARRLKAVTRILLAIFAMMLLPQGLWAQVDYYKYNTTTGSFDKQTVQSGSYTPIPYNSDPTVTVSLIGGKTYVVSYNVTCQGRYVITGSDPVNIILCDGATLTALRGIDVGVSATLNIYGQEKGNGQLNAMAMHYGVGTDEDYYGAAIGGSYHKENGLITSFSLCGYIFIHGGVITADATQPTNADNAAGIGGCDDAGPNGLTIYGGKVTAKGGKYSAGIGGGGMSSNGGAVSIYGGEVIATGGAGDGSVGASGYGPAMGIGAGSIGPVATGPDNGSLTLGTNVTLYDMATMSQIDLDRNTGKYARYQNMKTDFAYDLTFAGTIVKASNASDILNSGSATASFYPATNTLKLDNLTIDNSIQTSMDNLNILLEGANTLGNSGGYIRYNGNGTGILSFSASSGSKLNIKNNLTSPSAIDGFSAVNLNGVYLHTDNNPFKFDATNKQYVGINGGLQSIEVTTTPYYMLWIGASGTGWTQATDGVLSDYLGNLSSGAANSVRFDHDATKNTNTLTLDNAYIIGFVESGLGNLTIDLKGSNTIVEDAAHPSDNKKPFTSDNGGKLSFTSSDNTGYLKFIDLNGDPYSNPFDVNSFTAIEYNPTPEMTYNSNSSEIVVNYDLWVEGKRVSSANKDNIDGSSLVKFDPTSNTLTLETSANFRVNTDPAIKSGLADLKVDLKGSAWIDHDGQSTLPAFEGTVANAKVTFITSAASPSFRIQVRGSFFKNIDPVYQNDLVQFNEDNSSVNWSEILIRKAPWTGKGTETNPFLIRTTADLAQMATDINTNHIRLNHFFKLDNDIDCSLAGTMTSIGNSYINSFQGVFNGDDGNGSNYKIINQTTPYGLFGYIGDNSVIKNLTIDNCTVTGTNSGESVAGLVAEIRSSSAKINNCHVINSSISSGDNDNIINAGGIVGYQYASTVTGCSVENTTITMNQQARTTDQRVGGISGYFYGGTISNCDVKSSTISSQTSGTNELYTGAIAGELGIPVTLTNNTYDASVQVKTKKGSDSEVVRSGNNQRGTGEADANGDFDVFYDSNNNVVNGAVLTGLQTITLLANTGGTVEYLEGYYRYVANTTNNTVDVYALPHSKSNQLTKIKATSPSQYDTPTITFSALKDGSNVTCSTSTGTTGAPNATWEIQMPAENVTATIAYPIDFSNGNRTFAITNPASATKVYDGSQISITEIKTKPSATSDASTEVTLDISKNDFTITGYNKMSSGVATSLGTTAPTDAGDYQVVISGNGSNSSGTATVNFTIAPKSLDDNSIGVSVSGTYTYDGNVITPTLAVTDGVKPLTLNNDYSVSYQKKNDDGSYTDVTEIINAGTYKVVLTGTGNYTGYKSSNDFSIGKADIASVTVSITGWTYGEAANSPSVTAGNPGNATVKYEYKQQNAGDDTYTETVPTDAETYTVRATVPAAQNYKEAYGTNTFTIEKREVALDWTNLSFDYDGNEHVPTATVSNKVGSDVCTVTVTGGQTNAGNNYTATASGLSNNNYMLPATTTLTTTFTINQVDLSTSTDIVIAAIDDQTYTKSAITPKPTVTFKGKALTEGTDFDYGYINNIKAADKTATLAPTVTITAIAGGNFKNSTSTTFTILERTANITFNAGQKYKTFYSDDENLLVPDNVKAYVVTGVTDNTVNITPISYIHAKVPVLLESSSGVTTVKDPNETLPTSWLKYASNDVTANGKQYVLYSGEFVRASGTIPATKVYLDLSGSSSPARAYVIMTNNTTAIEDVFIEEADGDAKWYDMQGRRINKPTKAGLYIKDGKKVVVNKK